MDVVDSKYQEDGGLIICTLHQVQLEHVTRMNDMRNVYTVLVGNREGKRALGRPMRI